MSTLRQMCLILLLPLLLSQQAFADQNQLPQSYDELTAAGELAFSRNSYGQAEKCFIAALKEAERFGANDVRVANACKNLASYYDVRSVFPKAETYLERELRIREKAMGGEHPQVIQCVGKITRFYLARDNKTKADRLTNLLCTYADKVVKEQQSVEVHFNELNKFYTRHPEYADVQKQLAKLKENSAKVRAVDHLELAAILDGIGTTYKEKNKYTTAEQAYKKALVLREKALAPDHQALAFSYQHLADLYQAQGRTDLAQSLSHQALTVTGKALNLKSPESFQRIESLAKSYIAGGRNEEAEQLFKQTLTGLQNTTPARPRDIAGTSMGLGQLYCKQARFTEAVPLFKSALSITESLNGSRSAALIPILDCYAEALEKCNNASEAAKIRSRANEIKGAATACKPTDPAKDF